MDFGAPSQTWEQYSKEGRTWGLYMVSGRDDENKPRALTRMSFWKGRFGNGMDV